MANQTLRTLRMILSVIITITLALSSGAWAQSEYETLYKFTGGTDGSSPTAGVIFDSAGNLYGTTTFGGAYGYGTVFKLAPDSDGSWAESVLYAFKGDPDGYFPESGLIFDAAGNLYGTTSGGGDYYNGTVFQLTPLSTGSWTENKLHSFAGPDGSAPDAGLIFDQAGNLYGTTYVGGSNDVGTVFELTHESSGKWTESVLYRFCSLEDCSDGIHPTASLIFDQAGNLYGTTEHSGGTTEHSGGPRLCCGVVFKLAPNRNGTWTESVLHSFTHEDGGTPLAEVIFDKAGSLYGTTSNRGDAGHGGTVFKLMPKSDGHWSEQVLHRFNGEDGANPYAGVIFDEAGNLYGTTEDGGSPSRCLDVGCGAVFRLAPSSGNWKGTVLHYFGGNPGAFPVDRLIFDAVGNLYGTTYGIGSTSFGSVFEIKP